MAKSRKKPASDPLGMPPIEPEPEIDIDPVPPIEPDVDMEPEISDPTTAGNVFDSATPPTTFTAPPKEPTFRDKYGKYIPSRKWGVSTVGGIGACLIMWATTGTWDVEESVAAITLGVTAFSTWLVPNASGNPNEPSNY